MKKRKLNFTKLIKKKDAYVNVEKKGERSTPVMVCQVVYMVIN